MPEKLTLAAPIAAPLLTEWVVKTFYLDVEAPAVKAEFAANTGARVAWRYVASETVTLAQVRAVISMVNQGKFMTAEGKSLQQWLLDRAIAAGVLGAGAVSGAVD